jgi:hypothetical protein
MRECQFIPPIGLTIFLASIKVGATIFRRTKSMMGKTQVYLSHSRPGQSMRMKLPEAKDKNSTPPKS